MRPGGRVIVIEKLLGEMGEPGPAPFTDLNMMVMLPGRERTLSEYRALLKQAGFRLDKSTPIRPPTAVVEAGAARASGTKRSRRFPAGPGNARLNFAYKSPRGEPRPNGST